MAEGVVDLFEPVEVDQEHGERLVLTTGAQDGLIEAIVQQVAVWKAGERIMQGLMSEGFLCLFALGNVLEHGDGAAESTVPIELRTSRIEGPQFAPVVAT